MDNPTSVSNGQADVDDFELLPDAPPRIVAPPPRRRSTVTVLMLILLATSVIAAGILVAPRFISDSSSNKEEVSAPKHLDVADLRQQKTDSAEPFRQWTDATGKYQTKAKLVAQNVETIFLERETDGIVVEVPIARLSEEDRTYLMNPAQTKPTGQTDP